MSKKYEIPEEEPRMVSEPAMACRTHMGQVHMSFDLPETIDEESFRFLLMAYAQQLAQKGKSVNKSRLLSDTQLAEQLQSFPEYSEEHDATSGLTKEDYSRFMRVHKPIKGIEKWL